MRLTSDFSPGRKQGYSGCFRIFHLERLQAMLNCLLAQLALHSPNTSQCKWCIVLKSRLCRLLIRVFRWRFQGIIQGALPPIAFAVLFMLLPIFLRSESILPISCHYWSFRLIAFVCSAFQVRGYTFAVDGRAITTKAIVSSLKHNKAKVEAQMSNVYLSASRSSSFTVSSSQLSLLVSWLEFPKSPTILVPPSIS